MKARYDVAETTRYGVGSIRKSFQSSKSQGSKSNPGISSINVGRSISVRVGTGCRKVIWAAGSSASSASSSSMILGKGMLCWRDIVVACRLSVRPKPLVRILTYLWAPFLNILFPFSFNDLGV